MVEHLSYPKFSLVILGEKICNHFAELALGRPIFEVLDILKHCLDVVKENYGESSPSLYSLKFCVLI